MVNEDTSRETPDEESPASELAGDVEQPEVVARPVGDRSRLITEIQRHSGPLPPDRWLESVEKLHPGATEKIVNDYTKERAHQRTMSKKAIALDEKSFDKFAGYQRLRLLIVGGLALFLAAAGLALILLDKPVQGFVLLVVEITALVLAFLGREDGSNGDESADASTDLATED